MMDELEEQGYDETGFIKRLYESSHDEMMDLVYNSIVNKEMGALKHNAPIEDKIEGVQKILDFFKEREEYEKCLELKKIIDRLSC